MMIRRRANVWVIGVFLAAMLAWGGSQAEAMPGAAHQRLATLLLDTPPSSGGAKGLTVEQVRAVSRWMDTPAMQTGQYTNQAVGQPVHPSNHGHLRHNPVRVAKAMSGDGGVNAAKLNVARLHKIADVAYNTAGVDGSTVTPEMKREAKNIIRYVWQHKRLPDTLPDWVDQSGQIITNSTKSTASSKTSSAVAAKSGTASKAGGGAAGSAGSGKLAALAGGGVMIGRIVIEGGAATIQYNRGNVSTGQYNEELRAVGIRAVGSGVLTSAALVAFTNPGTAVVFIVAVGACIVVDVTYGIVQNHFDDSEAWRAFYERLPREQRQGLLVERIAPDPGMNNFGRTYGPIRARRRSPANAPDFARR